MVRKTKVICTLGPSSDDEGVIRELLNAGLDAVRLNFSHGTHEDHRARLGRARDVISEMGLHIPFILDTKGPEIRVGLFEDKSVTIGAGQYYTFTTDECVGNSERCSVNYNALHNDLSPGIKILIDDGLLEFIVERIEGTNIICRALNDGVMSDRKSVNIPGVKSNLPTLTDKDVQDLRFAVDEGLDYIAASFVQSPTDVVIIKQYLRNFGAKDIKVISKIENSEGVANFDEILEVSDGIMVARGDLGVEVAPETVPILQKKFIQKCIEKGKLVITATQMLDSMIKNPRPTRAEISDVANAVFDGTSAVMLSGETASGKYPIESLKTMVKTVIETEKEMNYNKPKYMPPHKTKHDINDPDTYRRYLNFSVYTTSNILDATAIIAISTHGRSPRVLSQFRPHCPIFVVTPNLQTARLLRLEWGIYPLYLPEIVGFSQLLDEGIKILVEKGLLVKDDTLVLSGGATEHHISNPHSYSQLLGGIVKI